MTNHGAAKSRNFIYYLGFQSRERHGKSKGCFANTQHSESSQAAKPGSCICGTMCLTFSCHPGDWKGVLIKFGYM